MGHETDTSPNEDGEPSGSPRSGASLFSDVRRFLIERPTVPTLIEFSSAEERADYSQRIMQRLGIDVTEFAILNIHRIGVEAPTRYVFEELLQWDVNSVCWPNRIAAIERIDGRLEHMRVFLLGRKTSLFGLPNGFLGLSFIPLFRMDELKFQRLPDPSDFDNARFLLYRCGGYPIGVFAMYVRSPISARGETDPAQLFMAVGFNFYGRKDWPRVRLANRLWERMHNRVTAHVLNRLKQKCEAEFRAIREGRAFARAVPVEADARASSSSALPVPPRTPAD